MKDFKIALLIACLSLLACQAPISFQEPQPVNVKPLTEFPKRLHGQFISQDDYSILTINKALMLRTYDYDYKLHPNALDSQSKLVGDTLFNLSSNEKFLIKHVGDSIVYHYHIVDTLFRFDDEHVLKHFKGYYFLNTYPNPNGWVVNQLALTKGRLELNSVSNGQDLENLKAIAESSADTIAPYKFKLSKRQFRTYLRKDGFSYGEVFNKI